MSDHNVKIEGILDKVHFSQKTFIIARIIDSNHKTHSKFSFKGFSNDELDNGDHVLITQGFFQNTKYGIQLENGTLVVIKKGKDSRKNKTNNLSSKKENIGSHIDSNTKVIRKQIHNSRLLLTDEQKHCIHAIKQGHDIKIKAYAGTGKTSTLVEIARSIKGRGLYLAYNKAIQVEASEKFSSNVACKTAHSLAYGGLYEHINGRVENMTPARMLSCIELSAIGGYQPYELAYLVLKILREFCNSHTRNVDDSYMHSEVFHALDENISHKKEIITYVINKANEYWVNAIKQGSTFPIEHDFYLKMYQLASPNLSNRFDFILFDECQDANPVLIDILFKQKVQMISVGDEHQQIYGWRGAINSFNYFEGETYYLSHSFRFGKEIANLASLILYVKGEKVVLTGNENVCSNISEKKPRYYTQLCRTNANLITKIIENIRKKVYVVGGTKEILDLARSGFALYLGELSNNTHSKIRTFKSWSKLIEFKERFDDPDISFLVNIIEDYGNKFGNVISKIDKAKYVKEEDASVILSTIHKAKGREWDNVSIGGDFTLFMKDESMKNLLSENIEEFNLLYVAITRAKEKLYLETDVERFMDRLQSYCNPIMNNI